MPEYHNNALHEPYAIKLTSNRLHLQPESWLQAKYICKSLHTHNEVNIINLDYTYHNHH